MENLDTDTENECFESAEESLDENEEIEDDKTKTIKSLRKSESEVAEPVVFKSDTMDSMCQEERGISRNLLSYRKRPERVKRLPSRTNKPLSKELSFKTDKIVPDVLYQDITSSLSKNINKSLSTLQQTSSNVKNLILTSIPVSSKNENEPFSYDEKNTLFKLSDEVQISNNESDFQNNNQSDLCQNFAQENIKNKEEDVREKTVITEVNFPVVGEVRGISTEKEFCEVGNNNIKEKDFVFKDTSMHDIVTEEIINVNEGGWSGESDVCLNSDYNKETCCSNNEQKEILPEKALDSEDSNNIYFTYNNSKILDAQKRTSDEEISEPETSNFLTNQKSENEKFDSNKGNCTLIEKNMKEDCKDENITNKQLLETVNNDLCLNEEHLILESTQSKSLEITNETDSNQHLEEKKETDSEYNIKELTMALKNVLQEQINDAKNETSENQPEKHKVGLEEKAEFNENVNDGWDDFDFSDDEIKDNNIIQTDLEGKSEKKKENEELALKTNRHLTEFNSVCDKIDPETRKSKDSIEKVLEQKGVNISAKQLSTDIDSSICQSSNSVTKVKDSKTTEHKDFEENQTAPDSSWGDWDNWGEISENEEENGETITKEKLGNEKVQENDSCELNKWSGWDTFAQKPQEKQGNWGFGFWGVDALLNKATSVTQGISSVLEAGLGAPDPETLAKMEKIEREKMREQEKKEIGIINEEHSAEVLKKNSLTNVNLFPVSEITSLVAGVTNKIVEHSKIQEIGSKVIAGGLDTLETFGKKTMEVLQEGDPGLKNKRALLLGNNKPVLSQVLREAREKADRELKKAEEKELAKKCHFETLFDDFQGMVHLEALEMLSRQCELKLDQIKSGMNHEEQEDLNGILEEVEQLCSLDECDITFKSSVLDFKTALQMAVEPLKNDISIHKIIEIHEDVNKWLQQSSEAKPSFTVINQKLVSTLANLTAVTVHQFHKSGELLCVKECRKTVEEVDALSRLTKILCNEINRICEKFSLLYCNNSSKDNTSEHINSVNEKVISLMKNSISYIRQAFELLIPVLQLGAAV